MSCSMCFTIEFCCSIDKTVSQFNQDLCWKNCGNFIHHVCSINSLQIEYRKRKVKSKLMHL